MIRLLRAALIGAVLFVSACASSQTASISSVTDIEAAVVEVMCDNGHGSGTVISADGLIVTANHVTADCPNMRAVFSDGTELPASLVASGAPGLDVSFIDVDAHNLPFAKVSAALPTRGEAIFTFGWPLKLGRVVTFGHVASEGAITPGDDGPRLILDLSIAPGNSGGGVFNSAGEIVGIINEVQIVPIGFGAVSISGFALSLPSSAFASLIPNA